tara:strand:- start:259 stop:588 length:330 start_codon:yes stop_codon:yes gene_type:complete
MKIIFFIFVLILTSCLKPAYSHDNESVKYSSLYLAQWIYQCSEALTPMFYNQGTPKHYAVQLAAQSCSCVIDQFRQDYTQNEVMALTYEERAERSFYYAKVCGGQIKEM